jgi:vacuolar-type H+-ATPase subunit E/Vma4
MKDEREQDPGSQMPPGTGDISHPTAGNGGSEVPEKADELLDRQKSAAGEELHSVADVMRGAARKFEEQQEGGVAEYVDKAADYVDRVSSTLRERNVEDLMGEVEEQLRRKPAVVLGAAAVVGFALGRFLRAGTQRIAKERRGGS